MPRYTSISAALLIAVVLPALGCSQPEPFEFDPARETACLVDGDLLSCRLLLKQAKSADSTESFETVIDGLQRDRPDHWLPVFMQGLYLRSLEDLDSPALNLDAAIAEMETALALALRDREAEAEVQVLYMLGMAMFESNRLERAAVHLARTQARAARAGLSDMEQFAQYQLAQVFFAQGRFLAQRDTMKELVARIGTGDNSYRVRNSIYELALAERDLGNLSEAVRLCERVISLALQAEHTEFVARATISLGVIALRRGDYATALERFTDGRRAAAAAGFPDVELMAEAYRGASLARLGQVEEGMAILESCLTAEQAKPRTVLYARVQLANIERRAGRLDSAELHYLAADNVAKALQRIEQSWESRLGLAAIYRFQGRLDLAVEYARLALAAVEELRGHVDELSERTHFLQLRADVYGALVGAILQRDPEAIDEAFEISERVHARTLQEALGESRDEREEIAPRSLIAVQQKLRPQTLLVEFLLGEDESHLFVLGKAKVAVHRLPARAAIEARVNRYRDGLLRPLDSPDARIDPEADFRRFAELGHELFEILLGPIRQELAGTERLIVVPDGRLHLLPLESLIVEAVVPGAPISFLGSSIAVGYLPAAAFLRDAPLRIDGTVVVVSAGAASPAHGLGELQFAGAEARAVLSAYDDSRTRLLRGADANMQRLRQAMSDDPSVLHIVAHAVLQPLLGPSVLLDEPLTARNLGQLGGSPELAVLSACDTARGELVGGEGILGLVRALNLAGTPEVVASLWQVDDAAAAEMMGHFHSAIAQHQPAIEALRFARQEILRDGFVHPFIWSPFVDYGASAY